MNKKAMPEKRRVIDWDNIAKYLAGGAMLGTGGAALYSFMKRFKRLESETEEDTSQDDDTLYVQLDKKASSQHETHLDDGLNKFLRWTAAAGGVVGAYGGTKWLFDRVRKRKLQQELDEAQQAYVDGLHEKRDKERNKYASFDKEAEGPASSVVGMSYGALLLLALASGVITKKTLDEAFPPVKKDRNSLKRRLVRGKPQPLSDEAPSSITFLDDSGEEVDTISTDKEDDAVNDAEEIESLIRTTTADKELAKKAGFDDILGAVATGRSEELRDAVRSFGVNHAFIVSKGAGLEKISSVRKELAIGVIANDPLLKSAFAPLFAAEFYKMSPHLCDAVHGLDEESRSDLLKAARYFNAQHRHNVLSNILPKNVSITEKKASAVNVADLTELLDSKNTFLARGIDSEDIDTVDEDAPSKVPLDGQEDDDSNKDSEDIIDVMLGGQ